MQDIAPDDDGCCQPVRRVSDAPLTRSMSERWQLPKLLGDINERTSGEAQHHGAGLGVAVGVAASILLVRSGAPESGLSSAAP
jgi:hypothetical protein